MKTNQIVIKKCSNDALALKAESAVKDFLYKDFADRKNFGLFDNYSYVDDYFSNLNKKLTIELSDKIITKFTNSKDDFLKFVKKFNIDGTLNEILSHNDDPLTKKIIDEIEKNNIKINKTKIVLDKGKSKKLFDILIRSFLNRKSSYLLGGCFVIQNKRFYRIVIYYKAFNNDNDYFDNIKSILSHELFHFNHCLSFKDDEKWMRSLNKNYGSVILTNIVVEGLAALYQLKYERIINSNLYYKHYDYYSSFDMFNFPYSAYFMYEQLDLKGENMQRFFDISSKTFNLSFSESYSKLFKYEKFIAFNIKRSLRMEN